MSALDYRDKIRALAEQKPVQPTEIAKTMSTDSMLASAMLAEMSEKQLLKVSNLKVGSSPLYYHPDHPEHLLNYVQHLNEKDRKTASLLQGKGIIRDKTQDPLTRVSLRNIKDFAKPLDVSIDGIKELFWKFYLLSDEEAAQKIKQSMQETKIEPSQEQPKPARQRKPRTKKQPAEQQQLPAGAVQEAVPAQETTPQSPAITDEFLQKLTAFFQNNNITVQEQTAIKKKSEYDFLLMLPSPVGQLLYYCKAKNKAKIAESDLSHAFVQGQIKKLPVLFLSTGALTKPAEALLKELKGLTAKQV
jgi:Mn-dependent DtxR family transcriptional regulator